MKEIIDYYNTIASKYDEDRFDNTYGKFIDQQERNILNKLLGKKEVILDLACGSGRFLNYANYGVDASEQMVAIAQKKHPNKKIFHSPAKETPLASNSIDTIISFHFFMHLNKESMQEILNECYRILKPNGRIIFDIPSAKRRKIIKYQNTGWHGNFSLTQKEINTLHLNFKIKKSYGILFIPIHRIPKKLRKYFVVLDQLCADSFLKEFSSYQIIELSKK